MNVLSPCSLRSWQRICVALPPVRFWVRRLYPFSGWPYQALFLNFWFVLHIYRSPFQLTFFPIFHVFSYSFLNRACFLLFATIVTVLYDGHRFSSFAFIALVFIPFGLVVSPTEQKIAKRSFFFFPMSVETSQPSRRFFVFFPPLSRDKLLFTRAQIFPDHRSSCPFSPALSRNL